MDHETQFTQKMHAVIGGVMDRVKTFYCREDLTEKLREVLEQYTQKRSGYGFRLKELDEMCAACGLDPELLLDPQTREQALALIPRRQDLRKKLLLELHRIWTEFPASSEYMARLVHRLTGTQGSVRLAILRQFLLQTDYHTDPVISLVLDRMDAHTRKAYTALNGAHQRQFIADHTTEELFDVLEQAGAGLSADAFARLLSKQQRLDPEGRFRLSAALLNDIKAFLSSSQETTGEILLALGSKGETALPLLECAEKEFCDWLKPTGKDKTYRQAKKDAKKAQKTDWTLLKLADDLASGKFRVNGITREQLYVFAIAFNLRYYPDPTAPDYDPGLDIVKNLFQDYYSDNLLRYVLDAEYLQNKVFYEAEPTGEGINYKNYVEVIYLYCLCQTGLTPAQKLQKAQALMDKAVKAAKKHARRVTASPQEYTTVFRASFQHDLMAISDEDALIEYLCTHYYIYNASYSGVRMMYASEQNTAQQIYRELAQRFMQEYPESFGTMYDRVELNNGIDVPSLLSQLAEENREDPAFLQLLDPNGAFVALLSSLDKKLQTQKTRIFKLCADANTEYTCTRTELITLYYCYYLNVLQELVEDYGVIDLPQLYEEFCRGDGIRPGIDHYLTQCRYQPICEKNAYDMFVIFAIFLELIRWDN